MIFKTQREREVYESELASMAGSKDAEMFAEHAVLLHRKMITNRVSGCDENGNPMQPFARGPRRPPIRGDVAAIVERLKREACAFFGDYPHDKGYTKTSVHTAPFRWYAMIALREAFGPSRASLAMNITEVGLRGAGWKMQQRNPEAYAAAIEAGKRLAREQESEAA